MNTLKNVGKRVVALVLALMMCVGMLATTAFAEDVPEVNEPEQEAVVEVQSKAAAKAICAHWDVWNAESTWETVRTTPKTCSEYAIEHQVCSKCGDTRDVPDISGGKADHTWSTGDDIEVVTEPKCLVIGTGHHYCKSCGASKLDVESIPALGHTAGSGINIWSWSNDNTHTATCARCGVLFNESHHFADATCSAPQTCTVCHGIKGEKDLNNHVNLETKYNADGHWDECSCGYKTEVENHSIVDGKCVCGYTETPVTPSECQHTDKIYTAVDSDHASHTWICTADGCGATGTVSGNVLSWTGTDVSTLCSGQTTTHTAQCGVCKNVVNKQVSGTGSHSFTNKWIQKGTGHVLQCDRCEYTSATSYGAHTMGDWEDTVEATCTSEGKETRACTKCDHTESRPTPKAQHVYENGSCVNCGQPDPNSPCEHQWVRYDGEEVYKAPTCTDNGVEYIEKCSLCGAQKTYANTALGHDFQDVDGTNTATCTEAGQKEQKCSRCEATQIVEVEALGHSYSALIPETPATCTTTGTQAHYVCTRGNCGALLVGTHEVTAEAVVIPATGHTPGEAVEENRVPARVGVAGSYDTVVYCDVCGKELSRENHTIPALPDTGAGDVVIDDTNPPLGGDPDGGDGEVELDDGEIPLAGPVTRAEFVDYLYRHEGSPDTALSTFVDVPADHDYANAVGWGQANNIAWGISETEFAPDELVTVEQVKLFLSRYAAFKGSEMPELAALVGLDDQDPAMNCDEILGEFFGADE